MILESLLKELEELKQDKPKWYSGVGTQVDKLESDHGITITRGCSARSLVLALELISMTRLLFHISMLYYTTSTADFLVKL